MCFASITELSELCYLVENIKGVSKHSAISLVIFIKHKLNIINAGYI